MASWPHFGPGPKSTSIRVAGPAMSGFAQIPQQAIESGLARLAHDLRAGA